ncbi:MAG TPA: 4-(cytidine 5'-diphospho)-2-C-methyl-D-erythritol kinase [Candidatus Manganitrophaceae bacterium]|nr:4-(cytidine 5'-diphospho)-2-C-methyl-D-erythritol kinase [Candidatus Manganitrophaceae bacterium]
MKLNEPLTLKAPAKINLHLQILSRREDGYHNLFSLMQMVGLYDLLTFRRKRAGIELKVENGSLPSDRSNLIFRAAELAQKEAQRCDGRGASRGVSITLVKKIPIAAGLGGGSSDAAATLIGLNRLWSLQWSRKKLAEMGGRLGSDLPFFFSGPTAWVSGTGEKVEKTAPFLEGWALLVNPGIPVSTRWVYEEYAKKIGLTKRAPDINMVELIARRATLKEILRQPYNDLEKVTLAAFPHLIQIKRELHDLGGEGVLMSGSGPTLFALFRTRDSAKKAAFSIQKTGLTQIWVVRILKRSPL